MKSGCLLVVLFMFGVLLGVLLLTNSRGGAALLAGIRRPSPAPGPAPTA